MKKILFCAGLLALAASCAENELDSISGQPEQKQGISFEAVEANDATTKGGFTPEGNSYIPFWYAETDQIAVWATNIEGTNGGNAATGKFDVTKVSTYKATQSAKKGVFTSASADDLLTFPTNSDAQHASNFLAVYPASLKTSASVDANGTILTTALPPLEAQTQKNVNGDGIYDNFIKWSLTSSYKNNTWDAVGERINLDFQRPLAGVIFATENADSYLKGDKSTFGKLTKITLTALGTKADGSEAAATASKLTYGSDAKLKITTNIGTDAAPKAEIIDNTTAAESKIELTMASGLAWSDVARAFMVIAPVTREKSEYIKAEYEFENIVFEATVATANSWNAGGFVQFPKLDVSKYDYLVTKGSTPTLIINKGDLSSIINEDGTGIVWPVGSTTGYKAFNEFKNIICNVALNAADLAKISKFTALEGLTLAENSELPAGLLANDVATKLKTFVAPKATKINKGIIATAFSILETLELNSYKFEDESVSALFLNGDVKSKLKTLNIAAVEDMTPTFGSEKQLDFTDYTALTEVTVKDGVKLSSNAFKGCTLLETVNGIVKLAVGAFDGCSALKEINIDGTVIPNNAFNGCSDLKSVLNGGKLVVPTEVGVSAFADTAIEYMDLSQTTKLGASAFKGSALISASKENGVLTVAAASIPASAFESTGVKAVEFTNATSFAVDIFNSCSSLTQVKFDKTFEIQESDIPTTIDAWSTAFGTASNINLFVAEGQKYVKGTSLTLPYKDTNDENKIKDATPITFKGIY